MKIMLMIFMITVITPPMALCTVAYGDLEAKNPSRGRMTLSKEEINGMLVVAQAAHKEPQKHLLVIADGDVVSERPAVLVGNNYDVTVSINGEDFQWSFGHLDHLKGMQLALSWFDLDLIGKIWSCDESKWLTVRCDHEESDAASSTGSEAEAEL